MTGPRAGLGAVGVKGRRSRRTGVGGGGRAAVGSQGER